MTLTEHLLKQIEADWPKIGACGSCRWHMAWYEVEESVREQLNYGDSAIWLVCPNEHGDDHRGTEILVALYLHPTPSKSTNKGESKE